MKPINKMRIARAKRNGITGINRWPEIAVTARRSTNGAWIIPIKANPNAIQLTFRNPMYFMRSLNHEFMTIVL
jgi:hypothetical protein